MLLAKPFGFKQKTNTYKGKKPNPKFEKKSGDLANNAVPEKQDWNKFKKDKKDLKLKRKQGKDLFELTVEGKKLYEKLKWYKSHFLMIIINNRRYF